MVEISENDGKKSKSFLIDNIEIGKGDKKLDKREVNLIGFVSIVLLTLAFSSVTQAAAPATPSISISPASIEVAQGDTFTIEIVVDPKGNEIYAVQYDLYFDNNLLKAISQNRGTLLSQDGTDTIEVINEINNSIGKVEYGETRTSEKGITNSGVLATISFEVIGASGKSELTLDDVILSDPNMKEIESEIGAGACIVGGVTNEPVVTPITAKEAHKMLEEEPEGIILLDVRTEEEYKERHIPGAINIPLSELETRIGELDKSKKIIVYCKTGMRSRRASEKLVQHDFGHVYNLLGGIEEWKIHFPVTTRVAATPAVTATPSVALSPSPSLTPAVSPKASPGFEIVMAIAGLIVMSYLVMKKRRRRIKR